MNLTRQRQRKSIGLLWEQKLCPKYVYVRPDQLPGPVIIIKPAPK